MRWRNTVDNALDGEAISTVRERREQRSIYDDLISALLAQEQSRPLLDLPRAQGFAQVARKVRYRYIGYRSNNIGTLRLPISERRGSRRSG
jgi:hypothetical protein